MGNSSFKDGIKIVVNRLTRKIYKFLWYDIISLVIALDISIVLWVFFEMGAIYYFMDIQRFPEENGLLYYGIVHVFILAFSALIMKKTRELIENLKKHHEQYALALRMNIDTWFEVYTASFSTAVSFYVLSMVLLIINILKPEVLKSQEVLQGQILITLLVITYLPLTMAIWIGMRMKMYSNRFETQISRLVLKRYQYNN